MKRISLYELSIIILFAFLAECGSPTPPAPAEIDIAGQVFIVTQAGTNFKLGLVEVKAYEEPLIINAVQQKKQNAVAELEKDKPRLVGLTSELKTLEEEFNTANLRWKRRSADWGLLAKVNEAEKRKNAKAAELAMVVAETQSYFKGPYWVADLPLPVQTTKTDADGIFIFRLKPGRYALVAESRRKVIDKTEEYYWIVWADLTKENPNRIFLSNDNLIETFCADCVVKPADISF